MNSQHLSITPINIGFIQEYLHKNDLSSNDLIFLKNQILDLKQIVYNKRIEYETYIAKTQSSMNTITFTEQSQNKNNSYRPPIYQKNISSKGALSDKMISHKKDRKMVEKEKPQNQKTQNQNQNLPPPLYNYENDKEKAPEKPKNQAHVDIPKIVMEKNEQIWENTDIFFKGLPPISQLKELLTQASTTPFGFPIDNSKLLSFNPTEHWSVRLNKFAKENKLKELTSINQNEEKLKKFWKTNKLPFQIENMQKKHDSPLQRLINALVESPPIQRADDGVEIPKRAKKHMLAPRIPYEPYLSLDFDQKLELELKSLGLGDPNKEQNAATGDSSFVTEIELYTDQLNHIIPQIQKYRDTILSQINDIVEKDKRMRESKQNLFHKYVEKQEQK